MDQESTHLTLAVLKVGTTFLTKRYGECEGAGECQRGGRREGGRGVGVEESSENSADVFGNTIVLTGYCRDTFKIHFSFSCAFLFPTPPATLQMAENVEDEEAAVQTTVKWRGLQVTTAA